MRIEKKESLIKIIIIIFEVVTISLLLGLLYNVNRYTKKLYVASEQRYEMMLAASRLRQSSDDLTNFARAYVVTGKEKFKDRYFKTLAIRNGEAKRPKNYDAIYWDYYDAKLRKQKHPDEKKLALNTIFARLPFTKEELAKLKLSKYNSDDLVNLEVEAFNAMKGFYKDKNGKYTIKGEPNQTLAIKLMHSKEYYEAKQKIMAPIDDFIIMLNERTKQNIEKIQQKINLNFRLFIIVALIFVIGNIFIFLYLRKIEKKKLENINKLNLKLKESEKNLEQLNKNLEKQVKERTKELEDLYRKINSSIKYASLIQNSIVSKPNEMKPYCKDSFVIWEEKDTVGGDIWLFNELRSKDETLLMVIDCTGHGVPGAFVTMMVKAIEREIVSNIKKNLYEISTSDIMQTFNKTMKSLLKQQTKDSLSNVGFDGGIIYYNRKTQIIKFSGAYTSLFYMKNDELNEIKGDRYSVGYKTCDENYKYEEITLEVEEGMRFFITTDGYIDQNGGEKGFPFGKKRFKNIIKENSNLKMDKLKEVFIKKLLEYQRDNERTDDITVVGFEIPSKSSYKELEEIIRYEGVITQNFIASCLENIDLKVENLSLKGKISTITIEMAQNIMHYSKDKDNKLSIGSIEIVFKNNRYEIVSKNLVSLSDKEKMEPILKEITILEKAEIKKIYRKLRRSGEKTHSKGGGIGFYEIAKLADSIDFEFIPNSKDSFYFIMKSYIKI